MPWWLHFPHNCRVSFAGDAQVDQASPRKRNRGDTVMRPSGRRRTATLASDSLLKRIPLIESKQVKRRTRRCKKWQDTRRCPCQTISAATDMYVSPVCRPVKGQKNIRTFPENWGLSAALSADGRGPRRPLGVTCFAERERSSAPCETTPFMGFRECGRSAGGRGRAGGRSLSRRRSRRWLCCRRTGRPRRRDARSEGRRSRRWNRSFGRGSST